MLRSVDSKDHMTTAPVTFRPSTGLFEAIRALIDRSVSGGTVIDDEGKVIGIISEMDCLQAVLSGTYHGEAGGTVADIMTKDVETIEAGANVLDVAKQLIDGHRRRFPVVQNGKFVGQISCRSILSAVVEFAETPKPKKE